MSNVLHNLSTELASVVQAASPGIVRIEARRRLPASGIVWASSGVIVTAHHIVQRDSNIKVGLPGGETVTAQLVGRDPATDLAVLQADATDLTPLPQASLSAETLQVGHLVLALGRPGQNVQATLGIVSALSQQWRTPGGSQLDYYLQTDVVMYPGFSGGPLVNVAGQAVGLNTSALLPGVSLAVPVSSIAPVVELLLAHGHIQRGYLGVSTQPVRLPVAISEQLQQETGLLLVAVEPNSPAEQGGLLLGDTIVSLEDAPVRQHDDLLALLSGDRVGRSVALQILRGGQLARVDVVVGERK